MSITLAGQSMIRSDIRATAPAAVPVITSLLKGDVGFTNLEGAIGEKGESAAEGRGFLAPPEALDALKSVGFNLLALSDNHAFDLKGIGIQNTIREANNREIVHAGTGGNTKLPTEGKLGEVAVALQAKLGPIAEQRTLTTIGAVVSSDLISQALVLILVGSIGILLWITYRFRDVKFGITALVALVHDVIVVLGTFAILGTFFHVEIDALFVTAMLTVIGFSVHDTIVVFDRVRENKARHAGEPFDQIVNHSILQTFGRSIMTSLTVVLTLLALLLFGGAAISDFILALLIGIVSGTYSSIFVAAPLLVDWHLRDDRRHGRLTPARAQRIRRSTS